MIRFPYGIADFRRIRREGMVYVDRTAHIRDLETLGSILVFLRPRRFGKSLWLQTLATYYDLRYADAFDEIFDGLAIGNRPPGKGEEGNHLTPWGAEGGQGGRSWPLCVASATERSAMFWDSWPKSAGCRARRSKRRLT